MEQPQTRERRAEPRQPKAFAFWIQPALGGPRTSAWMLDMSISGAAFLTAASAAPPIGSFVRLIEMQIRDRVVREDSGPLPSLGRVLRHDSSDGATRRVAVRFEASGRVSDVSDTWKAASMAREILRVGKIPPPVAQPGGAGKLPPHERDAARENAH